MIYFEYEFGSFFDEKSYLSLKKLLELQKKKNEKVLSILQEKQKSIDESDVEDMKLRISDYEKCLAQVIKHLLLIEKDYVIIKEIS